MNFTSSFSPRPSLSPYVHLIWITRTRNSNTTIITPTGMILLILSIDEATYYLKLSGKEFQKAPQATLIGQHYGPITTKTEYSGLNTITVAFKATALHKLWGVRMNDLTHRAIDAEEILGDRLTKLMRDLKEKKIEDNSTKLNRVNQFIEDSIINQYKKHTQAEDVIEFMKEKNGTVSVRELSQHFQCTPRFIERKFHEQVGTSPKYINRIIQFNHSLSLLKNNPELKWAELAYLGGYYDQAHLIKTFTEFTGKSPSQYYTSENLFTQNHLVKKQEVFAS